MIKFADVFLLGEDSEGKVSDFVARNIPYDWHHFFAGAIHPVTPERRITLDDLPKPNYTGLPPFKFNSLYWPTGAARWACMVCLASSEQLDKIIETVQEVNDSTQNQTAKSATLTIGDGETTQSFEMWLLPPHLVCDTSEPLWALPLVDARYFWQWKNAGVYAPVSWTEAFDDAVANLDLDIPIDYDAPSSDWGIPDPIELKREYYAVPEILDCVAHSTGTRIMFQPGGLVEAVTVDDSETRLTSNLALEGKLIAGGDFTAKYQATARPEDLTITFPKYRDHHQYSDGSVYIQDSGTSEDSVPAQVIINSTAFADYTGGSLVNSSALAALATAISDAYYGWQAHRYDYVYAGIVKWVPCGFDDYVIWEVRPGKEQKAFTRVCSHAANFGMDQQLQQFSGKTLYGDWVRGTLDSDLASGTTTSLSITTWTGSAWTDSGDNVIVYEVVGLTDSVVSGTVIHASWHSQSNLWVAVTSGSGSGTAEIYEGFLDTPLEPSTDNGETETTASMSQWDGVGSLWADTGTDITLTNRNDNLQGGVGDYVIAALIDEEYRPITISSADREFPVGEAECDCKNCIDSDVAVSHSCAYCSEAPSKYLVTLSDGVEYTLVTYGAETDCTWRTASTTALCGATDYPTLVVGGLAPGDVTLTHDAIVYSNIYPWRPLCTNEMRLTTATDCQDISCKVCIQPGTTYSTYDIYVADAATGDLIYPARYSLDGLNGVNGAKSIGSEASKHMLVGGTNISSTYLQRRRAVSGDYLRKMFSPGIVYRIIEQSGNIYVKYDQSGLKIAKLDYYGAVSWSATAATNGYSLAVAPDGKVYSETSSSVVSEFSAAGSLTGWTYSATRVAVDSSGNIATAKASAGDLLTKLDSSHNVLWTASLGSSSAVTATEFDSSGNVYVLGAFSDSTNLKKYNSSGTIQWSKALSGTWTASPCGMAIDYAGNVYVCDSQSPGYVYAISPDSTTIWSNTVSSLPLGIAVLNGIYVGVVTSNTTGNVW